MIIWNDILLKKPKQNELINISVIVLKYDLFSREIHKGFYNDSTCLDQYRYWSELNEPGEI